MSSPPVLKNLIALGLLFLGGIGLARPAAAEIDLPKKGKILVAVVLTADLPRYRQAYEAFLDGLESEPALRKRLKIFVQTPNPDPFSWENSVRRASGAGADILLTLGTPATLAARKEVPRLPTLYGDVFDPLRLQVEKAPHSIDDRVAGLNSRLPMTTLINTFKQIAPMSKIGVLFSRHETGSVLQTEELNRLSGKNGYQLIEKDIRSGQEIEPALSKLASAEIDVLYLTESAIVGMQSERIIVWCQEHGIPVIGHVPGLAQQGAILCLEADPTEQGMLLARCFNHLALGEGTACSGVRKPRRVEFLINLAAAEKHGLTVPFQALTLATRVISGEKAAPH